MLKFDSKAKQGSGRSLAGANSIQYCGFKLTFVRPGLLEQPHFRTSALTFGTAAYLPTQISLAADRSQATNVRYARSNALATSWDTDQPAVEVLALADIEDEYCVKP